MDLHHVLGQIEPGGRDSFELLIDLRMDGFPVGGISHDRHLGTTDAGRGAVHPIIVKRVKRTIPTIPPPSLIYQVYRLS